MWKLGKSSFKLRKNVLSTKRLPPRERELSGFAGLRVGRAEGALTHKVLLKKLRSPLS